MQEFSLELESILMYLPDGKQTIFTNIKTHCWDNYDEFIIEVVDKKIVNPSIIEEINSKEILCSMKLTTQIVKAINKNGKIKYPSLGELYNFVFNTPIENAHNSYFDVVNLHSSIKYLYDRGLLQLNKPQNEFSKLNVNELKQKCKECQIKKYSKMNKNELIEALIAHQLMNK
jgi:hypothetical protein